MRSPHFFVVGIRQVQGADGIVGEHPILGHQGGRESLGVFEEQAVVADAESQDDVEFAARSIHDFL